jgi:hypothetical protein
VAINNEPLYHVKLGVVWQYKTWQWIMNKPVISSYINIAIVTNFDIYKTYIIRNFT